MKMSQKLQLAFSVIYESAQNNKLLLLAGSAMGEGVALLYMGKPDIDIRNLYKCLASMSPYIPYLKAAVGGAIILGVGKICLKTLFQEMEKKAESMDIVANSK